MVAISSNQLDAPSTEEWSAKPVSHPGADAARASECKIIELSSSITHTHRRSGLILLQGLRAVAQMFQNCQAGSKKQEKEDAKNILLFRIIIIPWHLAVWHSKTALLLRSNHDPLEGQQAVPRKSPNSLLTHVDNMLRRENLRFFPPTHFYGFVAQLITVHPVCLPDVSCISQPWARAEVRREVLD